MSPDDTSIAIEERGQTELLKAQLASAIARAEKAEVTLAGALNSLLHCSHDHTEPQVGGIMVPRTYACPRCLAESIEQALSPDCGKDWVPKAD